MQWFKTILATMVRCSLKKKYCGLLIAPIYDKNDSFNGLTTHSTSLQVIIHISNLPLMFGILVGETLLQDPDVTTKSSIPRIPSLFLPQWPTKVICKYKFNMKVHFTSTIPHYYTIFYSWCLNHSLDQLRVATFKSLSYSGSISRKFHTSVYPDIGRWFSSGPHSILLPTTQPGIYEFLCELCTCCQYRVNRQCG